MNKLREIQLALPTHGKDYLVQHFLEEIEKSPLNQQGEPSYDHMSALLRFQGEPCTDQVNGRPMWFTYEVITECYTKAREQWEHVRRL